MSDTAMIARWGHFGSAENPVVKVHRLMGAHFLWLKDGTMIRVSDGGGVEVLDD